MANENVITRPRKMKASTPMLTQGGMPTLPGYVFQLNQLLSASEPDMDAVARVIRTDASLAMQVLRLANLYRLETQAPVRTIEAAVATVDVLRLTTMVITCPLLDCASDIEQWSCLQSFWQHNYMTGVLAKSIAGFLQYPDPELAYMAGLLRDIGELSMIRQAQQDESAWPEVNGDLAASKRRRCEAGRRLAIACKLTPELVEVCGSGDEVALAWHDPQLVKIVTAASRFCTLHGLVSGGAPRQLFSASSDETTLKFTLDLGAVRAKELSEILQGEFRARIAELEFNASGLMRAAERPAAAIEYELMATA